MCKKTVKFISMALICFSLFALPVNAEWRLDSNGWWYAENDGYATNWRLIDGEWYYFKENGYMVSDNYCEFINSIGSYMPNTSILWNGYDFFFNKDGQMLHDCFIIQGSGRFQMWIDNNGYLTDHLYGNKYSGRYDLSQSDLTSVPSLSGYSESEARDLTAETGLKLNFIYENVPAPYLDNRILGQTNIQSPIIKNETESTLVIGKYSPSLSGLTDSEIRNFMLNLEEKYDYSYCWLSFYGLY